MHTVESLVGLSNEDLDEVVADVVFDYGRKFLLALTGEAPDLPEYSGTLNGMGEVIERMRQRGFTLTITPFQGLRFTALDRRETMYALSNIPLPRLVAVTAVLAVQGA